MDDLDLVEKEVASGIQPHKIQESKAIAKEEETKYDESTFEEDDDNETIDDFIKKHLDEEPSPKVGEQSKPPVIEEPTTKAEKDKHNDSLSDSDSDS